MDNTDKISLFPTGSSGTNGLVDVSISQASETMRMPTQLSLNKEAITELGSSGGNPPPPTLTKRLSVFNWIDCGEHAVHWQSTRCGVPKGK